MTHTKNYRYTLLTFIGLTMALVANVRSIPTIAATGWEQLLYMGIAFACFALPLALISGELGTNFPNNGGSQLWVKESLGNKWGFVVAWLSWAQMFPSMIMTASTLAPLISQAIGREDLVTDHFFTFLCILTVTWALTFYSMKWNIAQIGSNYGVWIGVYIPTALLLCLGIASMLKVGIDPRSYLGNFSWHSFVAKMVDVHTLSYYGAIVLIFAGLEMTSVYIPQLKDYRHNYIRGIFLSLLLVTGLNLLNGLMASDNITRGKVELSNVSQPVARYCMILHLPMWIANLFSLLVACGILLQIASWINGPCHTITQVAREGLIPAKWHFYRTNRYDISKSLLLVQLVVFTLFALLYAFSKDVNKVFLMLTNLTSVTYMIVYVIIGIAFIKLRYQRPELKRPFRIGDHNHHNGWAWLIFILFLATISSVFAAIFATNTVQTNCFVIGTAIVMLAIPLVLAHFQKPQWLKTVRDEEKRHKDEEKILRMENLEKINN